MANFAVRLPAALRLERIGTVAIETMERARTFAAGRQREDQEGPDCGAFLILALPPGGHGPRTCQCFEGDRRDPLKSETAAGWLQALILLVVLARRGDFSFDRRARANLPRICAGIGVSE